MLKVYNTMTRRKEEFRPLKEGEVSIYCCGVTPYNAPHIGNARPFVTWDVIRRFFTHLARSHPINIKNNIFSHIQKTIDFRTQCSISVSIL